MTAHRVYWFGGKWLLAKQLAGYWNCGFAAAQRRADRMLGWRYRKDVL
jgi:hypothetical protein